MVDALVRLLLQWRVGRLVGWLVGRLRDSFGIDSFAVVLLLGCGLLPGGAIDTTLQTCKQLMEKGHSERQLRTTIVNPKPIKALLIGRQATIDAKNKLKNRSTHVD